MVYELAYWVEDFIFKIRPADILEIIKHQQYVSLRCEAQNVNGQRASLFFAGFSCIIFVACLKKVFGVKENCHI